jgi:hypothetical protein
MPLVELLEVLPVDGRAWKRTSSRANPSDRGRRQAERILAAFGARPGLRVGDLSATRKQQLRWLVELKAGRR